MSQSPVCNPWWASVNAACTCSQSVANLYSRLGNPSAIAASPSSGLMLSGSTPSSSSATLATPSSGSITKHTLSGLASTIFNKLYVLLVPNSPNSSSFSRSFSSASPNLSNFPPSHILCVRQHKQLNCLRYAVCVCAAAHPGYPQPFSLLCLFIGPPAVPCHPEQYIAPGQHIQAQLHPPSLAHFGCVQMNVVPEIRHKWCMHQSDQLCSHLCRRLYIPFALLHAIPVPAAIWRSDINYQLSSPFLCAAVRSPVCQSI